VHETHRPAVAYAGGAEHAIFVIGAQKLVADLDEAMRRIETHCLPLENQRSITA
jgi:hypothetical protein